MPRGLVRQVHFQFKECLVNSFLIFIEMAVFDAYCVDPYQTLCSMVSDLDVHYLSHVVRNPVFGSDQVRLKPACSATEATWSLETLDITSIGIILSRQRRIKALIRLHRCASWSVPLLFAYGINRFSHDVAHLARSLFSVKFIMEMD